MEAGVRFVLVSIGLLLNILSDSRTENGRFFKAFGGGISFTCIFWVLSELLS